LKFLKETDMPLHPKLQTIVDRAAALPPMQSVQPAVTRANGEKMAALAARPDVAHVEDRFISGPRGDIRIRIYRPNQEDGNQIVTYFHGSAFVICSIDTHDALCRHLCLRSNAVVVSVDYGLAPEDAFPAGPDDSLAATLWVAENAGTIGGDPQRLIVAGDSAGATMAIVTAMRARDSGGPPILAQFLIYPVTNYPDPAPPSYAERGEGCGLTAEAMHWGWDLYITNPDDRSHPFASPLLVEDLSNLPPAYIITAEYDLLRDEGQAFAKRLTEAGVQTEMIHYDDMNHGFMGNVGDLDRANEALDAACTWLAGIE
jgi:acetyl esterase